LDGIKYKRCVYLQGLSIYPASAQLQDV